MTLFAAFVVDSSRGLSMITHIPNCRHIRRAIGLIYIYIYVYIYIHICVYIWDRCIYVAGSMLYFFYWPCALRTYLDDFRRSLLDRLQLVVESVECLVCVSCGSRHLMMGSLRWLRKLLVVCRVFHVCSSCVRKLLVFLP
jgi:hypothetical protein